MYTLGGDASRRDTLLVPPTLGRVIDGPWLEDVLFFRDDMAAMAWAIEQSLDGPLDAPVSGFESQLAPVSPSPPLPAAPRSIIWSAQPSGSDASVMLRRGAMFDPSSTASPPVVSPRGVILASGTMLIIRNQAVPRTGVRVQRCMRRARWIDRSTDCWMARRTVPGKGQGAQA
jgi:hypothetical protein